LTIEKFVKLRDYIYRKVSIYFDEKKLYYVEKRVEARMRAVDMDSFRAYFAWMRCRSSYTGKREYPAGAVSTSYVETAPTDKSINRGVEDDV